MFICGALDDICSARGRVELTRKDGEGTFTESLREVKCFFQFFSGLDSQNSGTDTASSR
jgi:hypothetical protein